MQKTILDFKAFLLRRAADAIVLRLLLFAGLIVLAPAQALAQSGYCAGLQAEIARAGRASGGDPRAAARQQTDLNRAVAYARSLRCDREQFLFFGDPPPPQCAGLNARIAQLRASIGALRGGSDARRQALIARYNAECQGRAAQPVVGAQRQPRGFLEELFGIPPEESPGGLRGPPVEEPRPGEGDEIGVEDNRARGGSMAVCVRSCDGGFFPLNFSARRANLDDLAQLCRALCPNTDVTLYTKTPYSDISTAISIEGEAYSDHPNALKFQTSYDASCGCKPPGKSWVETLEEAERILAESYSKDAVVSAEQAEQLSRPVAPGDRAGRGRQKRQEAEGAPGGAPGKDKAPVADAKTAQPPEVYREIIGPDGVKKRVRVVAPSL